LCSCIYLQRRDCNRQQFFRNGFETVAALTKRYLQQKLTVCKEKIEGHEDDWCRAANVVGDALATDAR